MRKIALLMVVATLFGMFVGGCGSKPTKEELEAPPSRGAQGGYVPPPPGATGGPGTGGGMPGGAPGGAPGGSMGGSSGAPGSGGP